MKRSLFNLLVLSVLAVSVTACAIRLGGSGPRDYNVAVLRASAAETADQVAQRIRAADADIVLLTADRDTVWFNQVAAAVDLPVGRPGYTSGRGMAFMTDLELYGDTSLVLEVAGGGSIYMQDALYKVDKNRDIDLMMVRIDAPDLRAAVRTLLGYIATDVSGRAGLLLAVDANTPALADSVTVLMRATLGTAAECAGMDDARPPLRLLYGPSARLTCLSARGVTDGIAARVQLQR